MIVVVGGSVLIVLEVRSLGGGCRGCGFVVGVWCREGVVVFGCGIGIGVGMGGVWVLFVEGLECSSCGGGESGE